MLVLSRAKEERIILEAGDTKIVLTVVDIRGSHKVRLGIEAPKYVTVHREEVYNAIHLEKEAVKNSDD